MKLTRSKNEARIVLEETHIYFGGMNLSYQFSVSEIGLQRCFYISVQKADEFAESTVGNDLFRAIEYFQRVVKGSVTPCALVEVLADLQYA